MSGWPARQKAQSSGRRTVALTKSPVEQVVDLAADRFDDAEDLVAENQLPAAWRRRAELALDNLPVGATDADLPHLDDSSRADRAWASGIEVRWTEWGLPGKTAKAETVDRLPQVP